LLPSESDMSTRRWPRPHSLKSLCLKQIRSYTFREWIELYAQYRSRHDAMLGAKLVDMVEQNSQFEEWCDCKYALWSIRQCNVSTNL
jgi:hypothetical protein